MDNQKNVLDLIAEIQAKREADLVSEIKKSPRNNFYASDISDCDRQLIYGITNWKDKKAYTSDVIARFRRGRKIEKEVVAGLLTLGYEIIAGQEPFEVKNRKGEKICGGKIDGKISWNGKRYPLEIKSMKDQFLDKIDTYEDLDKIPWQRKYKRQMQLYLYGKEEEQGIMLFIDFTGRWKLIPVFLDYGECEFLLKRMEKSWDIMKSGKLSERMKYKSNICGMCNYAHICLPDMETIGAELAQDPEMEKSLERRAELEPGKKEYDKIDKEVKKIYRETKDIFIGINWRIVTSKSSYQAIDTKAIPKDISVQYLVDKERVTVDIIDLRKVKDEFKKGKEKIKSEAEKPAVTESKGKAQKKPKKKEKK